jgi:hypothetical protein
MPDLDPTLQGPMLPITESTWIPSLQVFKERLRFQTQINLQLLFSLSPNILKWVFPSPPVMIRFDLIG